MATHRLNGERGVVERPCSAWCRDGAHAAVWYGHGHDGARGVLEWVLRYNPGLRILAVEAAPEAIPPPDVIEHFAPLLEPEEIDRWLVVYKEG